MIWLWLFFLVFAQDPLPEPPLGDVPSKEQLDIQVYKVSKVLRCPTCQGVSVADSGADGAKSMKARIQELAALGYTSDQILDYFVSKYGEWILLRPKENHTILWYSPLVFLVLGSAVLLIIRKKQVDVDAPVDSKPEIVVPRTDSSGYRDSILAELEKEG